MEPHRGYFPLSSFVPCLPTSVPPHQLSCTTINRSPPPRSHTKRPRSRWICLGGEHGSDNPNKKLYNVTVHDPSKNATYRAQVPEDQYIWWGLREAGVDIPSSCRHGCCTTCAVRLQKGEVKQREALGLMKEMRQKGYALLCVSYPRSDVECTLQDEDEVYVQQFGDSFEQGGVEWGGILPEEE